MILKNNIMLRNIQLRTENIKLRAINEALEEKLKELENRYDKDKLVKRAERLAEDNVKIMTRYRKATKEKLRLKEKIKEVREYIEEKEGILLNCDEEWLDHDEMIDKKRFKKILEILDKDNK